jgi:hypothetical protein
MMIFVLKWPSRSTTCITSPFTSDPLAASPTSTKLRSFKRCRQIIDSLENEVFPGTMYPLIKKMTRPQNAQSLGSAHKSILTPSKAQSLRQLSTQAALNWVKRCCNSYRRYLTWESGLQCLEMSVWSVLNSLHSFRMHPSTRKRILMF